MTSQEFARKVKTEKLYEKAKKTLCGLSDGSIFIDGDLEKIAEQAKKEGLEFYPIKGSIQPKKEKEKPLTE
jgi:hypothetical protein